MKDPVSVAAGKVLALLAIVAVSAAVLLAAPHSAEAADRPAARSNSLWLARQLAPDGTLQNQNGGVRPDYGLMIDTLFALYASGDGALAAPIVTNLDDDGRASDYFTWDGLVPGAGFDAIIVGGAAAKVLLAAEVAGRDPRDFDGYDMVAETKAAIMRSGRDTGRVSDYSKNPEYANYVNNNSNMFGQSLAVIGLAAVGENDQLAIDTLLTQQCSEGYFRIYFHYDEAVTRLASCDEGKAADQSAPDGDATGLALSALLAAREAGATGLDEPIDRAGSWLLGNQDDGGGWGGGVTTQAPNTNSTGLIVQALADAGGADAAVDDGAAYLKGAQATTADASTALSNDIGAIAYTPEDYTAARTSGIVGLGTWVRASAQASLGLSQVSFLDLALGNVPTDPEPTDSPTPTPTATPTSTASPTPTSTSSPSVTPAPTPGATQTATPRPSRTPTARPTRTTPPSRPRPRVTPRTTPSTGPTPQVATGTAGGRLARYLAGRLTGGDHVEVTENGKTFVDYDATADLVLALRVLGEQPAAVALATQFLLRRASIDAYAHGTSYETGPAAYAEPLAKLAIIARFGQADSAVPATTVAALDAELATLRGDNGRFTDTGAFAETKQSVRRHAWATLATIAGTPGDSGAAVDTLVSSQCADGTFPAELGSGECPAGERPATAAAIVALNAMQAPGEGNTAAPSPTPAVAGAPAGWPPARTRALTRAAAAIAAGANDVIRDPAGAIDPVLSAAVAAGRQAVGLDTSAIMRAVSSLARTDGGLPNGAPASDLGTSVAGASGVAGRSWTAATGSPVVMAVRVPLPTIDQQTAAAAGRDNSVPLWLALILFGLGFLLAVGLLLARRHLVHRHSTHKVVAP